MNARALLRELGLWSLIGIAGFGAVMVAGPLKSRLPFQIATVESGSMEPAIPTGAVIVLQRVSSASVKEGDVITFHPPAASLQLETHRVVAIEDGRDGKRFVTQGDANPVPDAWRVPAVGEGWRYIVHVPYAGYVLSAGKSPAVLMLLVGGPVLLAGCRFLITLWRPRQPLELPNSGALLVRREPFDTRS